MGVIQMFHQLAVSFNMILCTILRIYLFSKAVQLSQDMQSY